MTPLPAEDWRRVALSVAYKVAHYDDAEDLAHDAILKVLRGIHRYPTATDVAKVTAAAVRSLRIDQSRTTAARMEHVAYEVWDAPHYDAPDEGGLFAWALSHCRDDRDRATVCAWAWGLSSAEQWAAWPALFTSISDVYNLRRLLAMLLRRRAEYASAAD